MCTPCMTGFFLIVISIRAMSSYFLLLVHRVEKLQPPLSLLLLSETELKLNFLDLRWLPSCGCGILIWFFFSLQKNGPTTACFNVHFVMSRSVDNDKLRCFSSPEGPVYHADAWSLWSLHLLKTHLVRASEGTNWSPSSPCWGSWGASIASSVQLAVCSSPGRMNSCQSFH